MGGRGKDDFISLCPPQKPVWSLHSHTMAGQSLATQYGALGRPRMESASRGCPGPGHCRVEVIAPPLWPIQARQASTHPLPACPALRARGVHCIIAARGTQGRAVPTGLPAQGGTLPSPWLGDQNHTRQNINYCCFQSPTTGGCLTLPRKSK